MAKGASFFIEITRKKISMEKLYIFADFTNNNINNSLEVKKCILIQKLLNGRNGNPAWER